MIGPISIANIGCQHCELGPIIHPIIFSYMGNAINFLHLHFFPYLFVIYCHYINIVSCICSNVSAWNMAGSWREGGTPLLLLWLQLMQLSRRINLIDQSSWKLVRTARKISKKNKNFISFDVQSLFGIKLCHHYISLSLKTLMIKNKTYRSFHPFELWNTDTPKCKLPADGPSTTYRLWATYLLYSSIIESPFWLAGGLMRYRDDAETYIN